MVSQVPAGCKKQFLRPSLFPAEQRERARRSSHDQSPWECNRVRRRPRKASPSAWKLSVSLPAPASVSREAGVSGEGGRRLGQGHPDEARLKSERERLEGTECAGVEWEWEEEVMRCRGRSRDNEMRRAMEPSKVTLPSIHSHLLPPATGARASATATCTHVPTHKHTRTHVHTNTHVRAHTHTHVHKYIHRCMFTYTYIYTCTRILYA